VEQQFYHLNFSKKILLYEYRGIILRKLVFFMALFCIISLVGCAKSYYYDCKDMKETVEKVEIVEFVRLDDGASDITLLKTLSDEEVDVLLQELSLVEFTNIFGDPRGPLGITLKLYFKNESFQYINIRGTQEFDKQGNLLKHYNRGCSEIEWKNFISKFMNK
jgi:hypothetical protein